MLPPIDPPREGSAKASSTTQQQPKTFANSKNNNDVATATAAIIPFPATTAHTNHHNAATTITAGNVSDGGSSSSSINSSSSGPRPPILPREPKKQLQSRPTMQDVHAPVKSKQNSGQQLSSLHGSTTTTSPTINHTLSSNSLTAATDDMVVEAFNDDARRVQRLYAVFGDIDTGLVTRQDFLEITTTAVAHTGLRINIDPRLSSVPIASSTNPGYDDIFKICAAVHQHNI